MAALAPELEAKGCTIVSDISQADVIILNTCSVTSDTESKTKRLAKSFSKDAPNARIMLTGGLAQQSPKELADVPNAAWIVGNTDKRRIPELIASTQGIYHHEFSQDTSELAVFDEHIPSPHTSNRTRFSVKIQEGCDYRCAYCIVPSLRGPSRSATRESVLDRVRRAIGAGYKEIILTGTHIGQFGDNSGSLTSLLSDMLKLDGDFRVRLSSLDPRDATEDLFAFVKSEPRICRHLHLSVQSLSPDVLVGMGRSYSEYDALLKRLADFTKCEPFAGLGADIIVGFPGESEDHFHQTLDTVEQIGFTYAHIFRYSIRPGTPAAAMPDQISPQEKIRRSEALRNAIAIKRTRWISAQIDAKAVHRIIVESTGPIRGTSGNYISIEASGIDASHNDWLDLRLVDFDTGSGKGIAVPV